MVEGKEDQVYNQPDKIRQRDGSRAVGSVKHGNKMK